MRTVSLPALALLVGAPAAFAELVEKTAEKRGYIVIDLSQRLFDQIEGCK